MSQQLPAKSYSKWVNKLFIDLLSLPDFYSKIRIINYLKKLFGERRFITNTNYGFIFSIDDRDLIQRTILYDKSWETNLSEFFNNELNENDVFFDIGSNVGYFSCLALKKGVKKVILFEPDKINTEIAEYNIKLNNFEIDRYEICNIALGDNISLQKFYRSSVDNTGTSGFIPKYDNTVKEFEVEVNTLDNYVKISEIPTVLKIDTEGFEYFILKGGEFVLMHYKPRLIIFESNTVDEFERIEKFLCEMNIYSIQKLGDEHGCNYIAKIENK